MEPHAHSALVTGGAKRIGRAISLCLAGAGYAVAIHCNRSEDEAQQRQFEQLSERLYAALRSDDLLQERKAEFARRAILDVFGQSLNPEQVQVVLERSRGDLAGFRQVLTRISQAREE